MAYFAGELQRVYVFAMRSMVGAGTSHVADCQVTQQCFLEAHELAFSRFRDVFRSLPYDKLKRAVKEISPRPSARKRNANLI